MIEGWIPNYRQHIHNVTPRAPSLLWAVAVIIEPAYILNHGTATNYVLLKIYLNCRYACSPIASCSQENLLAKFG